VVRVLQCAAALIWANSRCFASAAFELSLPVLGLPTLGLPASGPAAAALLQETQSVRRGEIMRMGADQIEEAQSALLFLHARFFAHRCCPSFLSARFSLSPDAVTLIGKRSTLPKSPARFGTRGTNEHP
jgi:hypothetical protein